MGVVRELTDRLWDGSASTADLSPLTLSLGLEEYAPRLAFVSAFANVTALETDAGLVLIDTGSTFAAPTIHAAVRAWSKAKVHTVVFTHGHVDHVMGIGTFEQEGRARVVAHEAIAERFARYRLTAGHNAHVNARQFRVPGLAWPTDYRAPDLVYRDRLTLDVGGESVELHHARGETDDHTWLHFPARRAVCTGDLFIWAAPNCGNPQKVQRHPREWAIALRAMAALAPALLFPGHGPAIEGEARVRQALTETAQLLETIHDQTLALMNDGAPLDVILGTVRTPEALLARPYLRPVYDEPEFVVRNVYRLYGGWWDGDPAHLKPPRTAALAQEIAAIAGGAPRLVERAQELSAAGDHALACQLVEWAAQASPDDDGIRRARTLVYRARAATETSLMAKSIFSATEDDANAGSQRRKT